MPLRISGAVTLNDVIDVLHAYAKAVGREPDTLAVAWKDGSLPLQVPVGPATVMAAPLASERLSSQEQRIVNSIAMLGGSPIAARIAIHIKVENDASLRKALAGLRRQGVLGGSGHGVGYPLTERGHSLSTHIN